MQQPEFTPNVLDIRQYCHLSSRAVRHREMDGENGKWSLREMRSAYNADFAGNIGHFEFTVSWILTLLSNRGKALHRLHRFPQLIDSMGEGSLGNL